MIVRMAMLIALVAASACGQELTKAVRDLGADREQRALAADACRTNSGYVADSVLLAEIQAANNVAQLKAVFTRMVKSRAAERAAERSALKSVAKDRQKGNSK